MDGKGACGNQIASYVAIEGTAMLLDLAILGIPIVSVSRLHFGGMKKLSVIVALDAGAM